VISYACGFRVLLEFRSLPPDKPESHPFGLPILIGVKILDIFFK